MFTKFGRLSLIMGFIGIFLAACTGFNLNYSDNTNKINTAAKKIADITPPASFMPEFTASANAYIVVSYKPDQMNSHLYLLQSTKPQEGENLENALAQIVPGAYDPKNQVAVIENQPVIVRGEETNLVISDGVNGEGNAYRQAVMPFEGKGGPALLIYLTPANHWESQVIDDLISSIQ